jgi:hypothetical protein
MVAKLRRSTLLGFSETVPEGFLATVALAQKRSNANTEDHKAATAHYLKQVEAQAPAETEPTVFPELDNLVYVSKPNAISAGVMYYVTKIDGKEVVTVVDVKKTPGLADWAAGMSTRFADTYGKTVNNVWTVEPRKLDDVEDFDPESVDPNKGQPYTDGGKYKPAKEAPKLADIERTGPEDEFTDVIRYEIKDSAKDRYGGEQFFYASKADAPEVYAYVVDASKILKAGIEFLVDGYTIADTKTIVPHMTQVKLDSIKPVEGVPDSMTFEMKNGEKFFVNQESAPSLYSKLQSFQEQAEALDGIDAPLLGAGAIYNHHITKVELTKDKKALPEGMLLVTIKGHPTFGDGTYLVTEADNSQAYDTALSWYTNGSKVNGDPVDINGEYNDINYGGGGRTDAKEFEERFGISREDWDIMSAETGERLDPKDAKSRLLTVGELAMKKLREKYEEEAKNDPDGKAAKFIALLDAVAAYSSGRPIQAYTQGEAVSAISGEYYVPSEDWQGVIDYDKLMAESNAIWQDPDIQKAYSDIVGEVIGGLDGATMEERAQKLHDLIVGDPDDDDGDTLALWLADMKEQGREGEAEAIVQSLWSSLAFLDKPNEEGVQSLLKEAMDEFQMQALMVDLSSQMEEGIGEGAYAEAAVQSNLNYILNLIKSAPNLLRLSPNAVNFIEGVVNGKISIATATKLFGAIEKMNAAGITNFTQEELDKFINSNIFAAPGEKDGIIKLANDLNKAGMLGTVVGGMSAASGILRLTQLDTENIKPEDVMLITRDFLSFLSFSEHYAKGIGTGVNKIAGLFDKNPNMVAYLGLNSSLPEIWGNNGRWGKKFSPPTNMWSMFEDLSGQAKTTLSSWATQSSQNGFLSWDKPENAAVTSEWLDHFNESGMFGSTPAGLGGTIAKTIGSAIKILGNGLDAPTGIIDIVFNALKISKAKGDPYAISSGVFGLLGGAMNTAAGAISGVNALFRTLTFASMSSPLFIVGAIFGIVSALIELFAGQRDTDKKLDKQRDWLNGLAEAGVMKEDWGKAFEFINTWYAYAKGRNDLYDPKDAIPLGLSIFDYDRERWDRFRQNWEPGELPREVDNFFNYEEERAWWANEDEDLVFDWKFSEDHHNPGNKISPDHPAAKEYQDILNGLAEWYTGNIDLSQKPVQLATFGNDTPKRAIEDMADFYLTYIDSSADAETIAEWIRDELVGRLPGAYDNKEDGERAAGAISVHFDKHGGKDDMVAIINGTFTETESPRAGYENTLNNIVSIYAETAQPGKDVDDEDYIDNDPISTKRRQLMGFGQEPIKALMVDLIEYYFKEVKIESGKEKTAEMAADWAIDQVKGRIGIAFRDALGSDNDDIREEAEEKIEIFENYVNKKDRSGRQDAIDIANEVLGSA